MSAGVAQELAFWRGWLAARGAEWPEEYAQRLDPAAALVWEPAELLRHVRGRAPEVLDVGAGPLTSLGKMLDGRPVRLTAIDPLATEYDALLAEFGVAPPVRTIAGDALRLVEQFGEGRFDLVHARNAIDHTADAPRAIGQMVAVARAGGAVFLTHARNEGARRGYGGMHAWNLDGDDRGDGGVRLVAWNAQRRVDVSEMLGAEAEVEVGLLPGWINVVIRRLG